MSEDLELKKLREEIHAQRERQKHEIEIDDGVALKLGRNILKRQLTQSESKQIIINSRKENQFSVESRRLSYLLHLLVSKREFFSKRERDRIRKVLDDYDQIDPETTNQKE